MEAKQITTLTQEEKQHYLQTFKQMVETQLRATSPKDYKEMVQDKSLAEYLKSRAETTLKAMEYYLAQGYNTIEAREIATHQNILD